MRSPREGHAGVEKMLQQTRHEGEWVPPYHRCGKEESVTPTSPSTSPTEVQPAKRLPSQHHETHPQRLSMEASTRGKPSTRQPLAPRRHARGGHREAQWSASKMCLDKRFRQGLCRCKAMLVRESQLRAECAHCRTGICASEMLGIACTGKLSLSMAMASNNKTKTNVPVHARACQAICRCPTCGRRGVQPMTKGAAAQSATATRFTGAHRQARYSHHVPSLGTWAALLTNVICTMCRNTHATYKAEHTTHNARRITDHRQWMRADATETRRHRGARTQRHNVTETPPQSDGDSGTKRHRGANILRHRDREEETV